MGSSQRGLFIDMVVDMFIFKNNQMALAPCFIFIPETGVRLPKREVSFYCNTESVTFRTVGRNPETLSWGDLSQDLMLLKGLKFAQASHSGAPTCCSSGWCRGLKG